MSSIANKKVLSHLGAFLFSIFLLGAALWALYHELKAYKLQDILESLNALPKVSLLWGIGLTALGYWIVTAYDWLALQYIRHPLPYPQTAFAAFISFALANTLGFVLLTSSAIRYRLYLAWGLSGFEIAQVIAFGNLSFWLGMLSIGGILFAIEPLEIPDFLKLPINSLQPLGGIFIAITLGYLILSFWSHDKEFKLKRWSFRLPSGKLSILQILVSILDWGVASGILYLLLPQTEGLSFPFFFAIYLLAQLAGILSHVPGGLGVFETAIVLLLSPTIHADRTLAALLAYRAIYYFLPFGVAALMLSFQQWKNRRSKLSNK
ncbi:MAG TPA: UPF0104 family protein [Oscillatoriales cyanobacterium M59_W2019_021]|nr:UPF0104 family protein [Oscillatoriales cyanobacterium M4454_W2019_049]HIK49946.1 UPF0104 family protein [Oscillatoriales cyanobacterium M59_W2019_021]